MKIGMFFYHNNQEFDKENKSLNIFSGALALFWAVKKKNPVLFNFQESEIRYQKQGLGDGITKYNCFILWHNP